MKKVTVRFTKKLKEYMQKSIMESGYGFHGKSKWVSEAVMSFLNQPHYLGVVDHGIDINQGSLDNVEAFYFNEDVMTQLQNAVKEIRQNNPFFEGVQSAIVRASIINRLLGIKQFSPQEKASN